MAWNGGSIQKEKNNKISSNNCNHCNISRFGEYLDFKGHAGQDNPLKVCIDDRDTPFKIKATLEIIIDGLPTEIPANINSGLDGECQRAMYTLTDDGTIYAEWEEEYPFEIGHFLWMWDFPLRDMDQINQSYTSMIKNHLISSIIHYKTGYHYKAVFTTKAYDESKDYRFPSRIRKLAIVDFR